MPNETGPNCSCKNVKREIYSKDDGSLGERWRCADCGTKFVKWRDIPIAVEQTCCKENIDHVPEGLQANTDQALEALRSERAYQDDKWPGHFHELSAYCLYMQHHVDMMREILSTKDDSVAVPEALEHVRKIGGLAVRSMEEHGAPRRQGY